VSAAVLDVLGSPDFYTAALRVSAPLVLAATGGLVAELAGIVTFGMEGWMLAGTFIGVAAAHASGSTLGGFAGAALAGALLSGAFGLMVTCTSANQVVAAVAMNLFAVGATSYLNTLWYGLATDPVRVKTLAVVPVPGLHEIPVVGPILFRQMVPVYLAYVLVVVVRFMLYRTTWGLAIRAVGEHPRAADTAGIRVRRLRILGLLVAGACSGIAGAMLSVGQVGQFSENMSGGRGFIAYTAIVFGKWTPLGTALGCLLFGTVEALQLRLQALGITVLPYQVLIALPYVATLVALVCFVGEARWPSASGQAFERESR
jgi:ABC-type uncharacterized transport system permease subunit